MSNASSAKKPEMITKLFGIQKHLFIAKRIQRFPAFGMHLRAARQCVMIVLFLGSRHALSFFHVRVNFSHRLSHVSV